MFDEGSLSSTPPRRSVASEILWSLAHEQGSRSRSRTTGSSTRSSRSPTRGRRQPRRARPHLPLDGADPVLPTRGRTLGACRDRRRLPLAADHTLELRFNPMKRNRGGERDLDHIILAAVRGLDSPAEYPQVRCGLILMMDRTFEPRQNEIVVEKAIAGLARRGRRRLAGPVPAAAGTTTRRSSRWSRRRAGPASASRSTSARRARPARRSSAR